MQEVPDTVVLARVATALQGELGAGLAELQRGLRLRTVVLRAADGSLAAVAGEVVHAVPASRPPLRAAEDASVEVPVPGPHGDGRLVVVGARPSQLPVLRACAAVLGLALAVPRAAALVAAEERDRDALADALHDGPVQSLVVARYAADAAVRGADPTLTREAVQEALVALRRTLWQLRPRGAAGLAPALSALSAQRVEAGLPGVDLHGARHADLLSADTAVTAYRLVQAVGARSVRLRRYDDVLQLDLDGGDPLTDPDAWRSRAAAVGGDLTCTARHLRLVLPLAAPRRAGSGAPLGKATL